MNPYGASPYRNYSFCFFVLFALLFAQTFSNFLSLFLRGRFQSLISEISELSQRAEAAAEGRLTVLRRGESPTGTNTPTPRASYRLRERKPFPGRKIHGQVATGLNRMMSLSGTVLPLSKGRFCHPLLSVFKIAG